LSAPLHSTPGLAARLEGRAAELAALSSLVRGLGVSGGALVLVGDPGSGKTALLHAAHGLARDAGVLVLAASAAEFELEIPFSGLSQIVLPLRTTLDQLGPPHREALDVALGLRDGRPPALAAVASAALALLREASRSHGVLLLVDDLPWLDRVSAAVFSSIARRLSSLPVGLVATVRTGASTAFDRSGLVEYELRPLDEEACVRLLRSRFADLPRRELTRLVSEARGNPLALIELPRAGSGLAGLSRTPVTTSSASVSRRVEMLFAGRVDALPPQTRRLLLLTALSGSGDLHPLAAAAGRDFLDDLALAEGLDLVSVDHQLSRMQFRHPLAAAAVLAMSTAEERCAAHRALADLTEGDVVRHALHLAGASVGPDEDVADALEKATRRCLERGDPNSAVRLLVRAAQLSPSPRERNRRLSEAAYLGADVTGDLAGALQLLAEVRSGAVERGLSLAAVLATSYVLLNADCDIDAAHSLIAGALAADDSDVEGDDDALVGLLHSLLMICWTGGREELWSDWHRAAPRVLGAARELLELCAGAFGDPVRAAAPLLDPLSRAIAALPAEQDPVTITRVGLASVYVDRVTECRPALWRVVESGRSGGAVALGINALTTLSVDDWHHGRWDQVQEQTAEGLRLAEEHGYRRYSWILGSYLSTLVATVRGDVERGRAAADELSDWAHKKGAGIAEAFASHLRCLAALSMGDFPEAYDQAGRISPAGTLAPHAPHALWVALDLVEAASRSGRSAEAQAHVQVLTDCGVAALSPRLALVVGTAAAVVAPDEQFRSVFERALALDGASSWPFEHARAQLLYGERLRRARSSKESRGYLSGAAATFTALGAAPWAARAEQELRATGQRRSSPGRGQADALTPQELQIAQLAAKGRTNKQIGEQLYLSPRTVGAHLATVFPRLGVTSRAALRDALTAAGYATEPGAP
jgi:DNA-binding CsgD family transcriptional regulator